MGRPAANRKVFLFLNKAADQKNLQNASVQFIGVYRTNKQVSPSGMQILSSCHTTANALVILHKGTTSFRPEMVARAFAGVSVR